MPRFILFLVLYSFSAFSQKEAQLHFEFTFFDQALHKDVWYVTQYGDSVQIDKFQFFVSLPAANEKEITLEKVHLVDWLDSSTYHWNVPLNEKKELIFTLGLDSIYHVSSVMEGDLNPAKGMYWAWQSGYIQLKIEGRSPSCDTRKNKFQYHLGGYLDPFCVAQTLNFGQFEASDVKVTVDLFTFFRLLDIAKTPEIMVPGKNAVKQMKNAGEIMSIPSLEK